MKCKHAWAIYKGKYYCELCGKVRCRTAFNSGELYDMVTALEQKCEELEKKSKEAHRRAIHAESEMGMWRHYAGQNEKTIERLEEELATYQQKCEKLAEAVEHIGPITGTSQDLHYINLARKAAAKILKGGSDE